jgi:sensor histidine kinase YesM
MATVADQFIFSPVFNFMIFTFIAIAFKGGFFITLPEIGAETLTLGLSLVPSKFPGFTDAAVLSTLKASYQVWLPATVFREMVVAPRYPHLTMLFVQCVAFLWSVVFAMLRASE